LWARRWQQQNWLKLVPSGSRLARAFPELLPVPAAELRRQWQKWKRKPEMDLEPERQR